MKILFSSYAFSPDIGGIEAVSGLLAREFVNAGHEIVLLTETRGQDAVERPFRVVRHASLRQIAELLRWCEVVFQNNISLRHLIPALLMRKRVLVVHQTWIRNTRGDIGWNGWIKRALLPGVKNVAISRTVADDIGVAAEVIGNPYDENVFKMLPDVARQRAILFVGRLVSDKGADLLLHALARLREQRRSLKLTIVGSGPEEEMLRRLVVQLRIEGDVEFVGAKSGAELARLMNGHELLAIPSRWREPFGIVALEGIACGCVVIGSQEGGLPEAIGPCGLTFSNGDSAALAERLGELFDNHSRREQFRAAAAPHLAQFHSRTVAARYLELLRGLAS